MGCADGGNAGGSLRKAAEKAKERQQEVFSRPYSIHSHKQQSDDRIGGGVEGEQEQSALGDRVGRVVTRVISDDGHTNGQQNEDKRSEQLEKESKRVSGCSLHSPEESNRRSIVVAVCSSVWRNSPNSPAMSAE